MKYIAYSARVFAKASDGNPVITTVVVMLFFLLFNLFEALIEILIFGERFEHWLDVVFMLAFIAYSGYAVFACAELNSIVYRRSTYEDKHQ